MHLEKFKQAFKVLEIGLLTAFCVTVAIVLTFVYKITRYDDLPKKAQTGI